MQVTGSSSLSRAGVARVDVCDGQVPGTARSPGETAAPPAPRPGPSLAGTRVRTGRAGGAGGGWSAGSKKQGGHGQSAALWGKDGALLACRCLDGHPCRRQRPVLVGRRVARPRCSPDLQLRPRACSPLGPRWAGNSVSGDILPNTRLETSRFCPLSVETRLSTGP